MKVSSGEQLQSLHWLHSIILPKRRTYPKSYNAKTKWMYILIEDDALLKIYIYIDNGNKVSSSIK